MNCKKCGRHAICCKERWINKNAMAVDFFCFWHAPKGAEYYFDGLSFDVIAIAVVLFILIIPLIRLLTEVK